MREIKFYWRREHFPIAGMFTKCLCRNGNISFSKNNLAYSCSLRTCILSVLEYSERVFPFHMRRKFSLNPKVSLIWTQWRPMLLLKYHVNFGLRLFYSWSKQVSCHPSTQGLNLCCHGTKQDWWCIFVACTLSSMTGLYTPLFFWDSEQECKPFFDVTQDFAWFTVRDSCQQNSG